MIRIYGDLASGNCYKIKLLTRLLAIPHQWIKVDILSGETHSDSFRAINPVEQIPVLQLEDGRHLSQSNAILYFLAKGSDFLPKDDFAHAEMLQWQFFEQYSHEPYIAVARYISRYLGLPDDKREEYASRQAGGHRALSIMQTRLEGHNWLAANRFTLADISLYAYTHVAHEGGFDLNEYPAILSWIARIEEHPNHQTMQAMLANKEGNRKC